MSPIHSKTSLHLLKRVFPTSLQQNSKNNFVSLVNAKKSIKIIQLSKNFHIQNRFKSTLIQSVTKGVNYSLIVVISLSAGLVSGSFLVKSLVKTSDDPNEESRSVDLVKEFVPTKIINHHDSLYQNFPLSLHLYQFENCPYCSQIRAYLDYFGFCYTLTEVDSYTKEELSKFTRARKLPILVLEDRISKKKWHLANATAIISALESLRNEKHINFSKILDFYLPILRETGTFSPNKYSVSNSNLNSIEWRKWINNFAIPVFNLNSVDNLKNLIEKFDIISEKSGWKSRYNSVKYYIVYYYNVYKAYSKKPSLINRLDSDDQTKSPTELLDRLLTHWEHGLGEKKFINGSDNPDLADLSMYGNVRAYEGCTVFRESIAKYPKFRKWYERMNQEVLKGFNRLEKKSIPLFSQDLNDFTEEKNLKNQIEKKETASEEIKPVVAEEQIVSKSVDNEKVIFRVLSATYLIHVFAFAFAAYMNK